MMYITNQRQTGWRVVYYERKDGSSPAYELVEFRTAKEKAKILSWIGQLEVQGPHLPRPYADLLEDGIHELRIKLSGDQVRVLYFFCYREFIVLTHGFIKNTDRVPLSEIARARQYRADFLSRFDEETIRRRTHEDI
jgi:phage-related protein